MSPIFFTIGGFEVHYYGLMYAIAFLLGIELVKLGGKKKGYDPNLMESFAFVAMISGLIGGRLYYVLFNHVYYFSHPGDIIAVWKGGMAIHGGILGGIIGTYLFAKKNKISMWSLGDIAAAPFILGQAIGRIGNFANGEVHGVPTFTPFSVIFSIKPKFVEWFDMYNHLSLTAQMKFHELVPWGIVFPDPSPAGTEFPGLALHPAMLYELILNFIAFLSIWLYFRHKNYKPGVVWFIYIIEYSLIRTFVSFFRSEDLMFYGFRAPHVISVVLVIWSIFMIKYFNSKKEVSN
ncbi:MAG: prolipoprotein diacylglyceryl transferase [Psychrilyobacter sp.]|nr:prolipoprotein diacylglyceryl transferase [Psychrilyobacter sp.]